jgi:hypothetical protein
MAGGVGQEQKKAVHGEGGLAGIKLKRAHDSDSANNQQQPILTQKSREK